MAKSAAAAYTQAGILFQKGMETDRFGGFGGTGGGGDSPVSRSILRSILLSLLFAIADKVRHNWMIPPEYSAICRVRHFNGEV